MKRMFQDSEAIIPAVEEGDRGVKVRRRDSGEGERIGVERT